MLSKLKTDYLSRLDVRLTLSYTLILLCITTALGAFFYIQLERIVNKQVDRILADETQELVDDISQMQDIQQGGRVFEEDIARRKYYTFSFRVLSTGGAVLYLSKKAHRLPFPEPRHSREFSTLYVPEKNMRYRLFERRVSDTAPEELYVQIVTEKRQDRELLERFFENLLLAFPVVLVLSFVAGMFAARRPRQIIREIARVTGSINSSNLQERLAVPEARDDVRQLTIAINAMMERLEKSFAEIKQFTADVSHELRNPLFALKGTMEVALSGTRDAAEFREALSDCLERINYLIKMANDLFLISRFEMQRVNLDLESFNMAELVRDMCDFFLPMAQDKQLELAMDSCCEAVICADRTRLLQLVSNLIENAVKFTPAGGRIGLGLDCQGDQLRLQVRDTGIGIPETELPHVFKRFYQVDSARSGFERGTGLGLQICKRIAEAHGGTVAVERNEGRGVTVTVLLPVHSTI